MVHIPKTVLIVEDSPVQARALQDLLEQNGLRVLRAPDGQVGIAMAEQHIPNAIVLDVQMPEMNGFEVCRHLKGDLRTAGIPVVILTAHGDPDLAALAFEMGAVEFVPKDVFSEAVLLRTLRHLGVLEGGTGNDDAPGQE